MSDWLQLRVPPFCERLIGFSIPQDGEILVISYEGYHLLKLGDAITIHTDSRFTQYDLYDLDNGIARYQDKNYQIIGLHGGVPLIEIGSGERLSLNTESKELSIISGKKPDFSMKYQNFSGDWAVATFSPDGEYVVLGCPYDFDFLVLKRFNSGV